VSVSRLFQRLTLSLCAVGKAGRLDEKPTPPIASGERAPRHAGAHVRRLGAFFSAGRDGLKSGIFTDEKPAPHCFT
jgi:hypothetical protein